MLSGSRGGPTLEVKADTDAGVDREVEAPSLIPTARSLPLTEDVRLIVEVYVEEEGFGCNAGAGPLRITLPLPVMTMADVREPPMARGAPIRDVPAAAVAACSDFVADVPGLLSTSSSSCVNSEGPLFATLELVLCFCNFLGLPSSSSLEAALLLRTTASLPRLLLPAEDAVVACPDEVIAVTGRGGGAVCEKRHGLRLHGPPGLLADRSGHRTAANRPSVGNIRVLASHSWEAVEPLKSQR